MIKNEKLLNAFTILNAENRLHGIKLPIIALTGGIATGKSTVVNYLKSKNYQVIMADQLIKEIYELKSIQEWVKTKKPQVIQNEKIDFSKLRTETFNDTAFRLELEQKLYAHLPETFRKAHKQLPKHNFFFYEVPLLIEKKLYPLVDIVVLIHSDSKIQKERLSKRDQSSQTVNENILKAQLGFEDKKPFAHFILQNNSDEKALYSQIDELLATLKDLL